MLSSRPVALATDGRPLHAKTPGRSLLKGRSNLQENTVHRPTTGKATKASFQTPFHDDIRPTKLFQGTQPGKSTANPTLTTTLSRPLGDKTPFPNRVRNTPLATPAPTGKISNLTLLAAETPGYLLRPSSTRKSVRARRSSGPYFSTPVTNGNHWDVSEGDIDVGFGVDDGQEVKEDVSDYDEIEYMPPTAVERPYEPAFDMPDYKVVGELLFEMMHSYPRDDGLDRYHAAEKDRTDEGLLEATGYTDSSSQWDFLPPPVLQSDDPFASPPPPPTRPTKSSSKSSIAHSRAPSTFSSRPASTTTTTTASARRAKPPLSRAPSTVKPTSIPAPAPSSKPPPPRPISSAPQSTSARPAPPTSTSRAPPKPKPISISISTSTSNVLPSNRPATATSTRISTRSVPVPASSATAAAAAANQTRPRRPLSTLRSDVPMDNARAGAGARTKKGKHAVPEDVMLVFDEVGLEEVDDGFVFDV